MTEAEWMACTSRHDMLAWIHGRGCSTERKIRLFGLACCRRVWHLLPDQFHRDAVELVERYVDGTATVEEFKRVYGCHSQIDRSGHASGGYWAALAVFHVMFTYDTNPTAEDGYLLYGVNEAADDSCAAIAFAQEGTDSEGKQKRWNEEAIKQADIVREIILHPDRPSPTVKPSWLAWNNGAIRKMVPSIYDARAFDRLPLLADALEDAGCTDADILAHCRGGGEHVRGCWVVDLLLGKA